MWQLEEVINQLFDEYNKQPKLKVHVYLRYDD